MVPPEEWPIDRAPKYLEAKLGPFEDYGDWQRKRGEEHQDRLGEGGIRLASILGTVQKFLHDYDMTPEEAIEVLEYEIDRYEES